MIELPWTRQPSGASLRPSTSTLVSGARGLWSFQNTPRNLITGEPTVLTGSAYYGVGKQGQIARMVAGSNRIQLASDSRNLISTSGGHTIALHYRKIGAAAATAGFGLDASSSALIRAGTHFPFSDGTLYWDFGGNSAGSSRLTAAGLTFGDDFWVFTAGVRGMEIWQNGIRRAQQGSAVAWFGSSNPYLLGMHGTATNSDDAECSMFAVIGREWSPGEIEKWFENPWKLFRTNIFYVSASPGKTASVTLDAAIQEAKTATATLNAAIQEARSGTSTLDAIVSAQRTATTTLDAAIQAAVTATSTLDAAIQAAMSSTSTLDAVITVGGSTTLTATLDAAIQQAKSLTSSLDAAIQISNTATVTLNGVIVDVRTATATLDATILAATTAYALLDAYIFDADAPVEEAKATPAGRARRRYILPDDTVVYATPREIEQVLNLFTKPKTEKKTKRVTKTLKKVEFEPVYSDTVPTEKVVMKANVWKPDTSLYEKAVRLFAQRELKRRFEEELLLLS